MVIPLIFQTVLIFQKNYISEIQSGHVHVGKYQMCVSYFYLLASKFNEFVPTGL